MDFSPPLAQILRRAALAATMFIAAHGRATAAEPHFVVEHAAFTSTTGACVYKEDTIAVEGVPADVKARIDAILAKAKAGYSDDLESSKTASDREAECASDIAKAKAGGADYHRDAEALWEPGYAHGRWLSARFHVSLYLTGGAHGSDTYTTYTFDLTHGGYPVPTGGFYLESQRKALNTAVADAYVAMSKKRGSVTPEYVADIRGSVPDAQISADDILLTDSGIEVQGFDESEATRNDIVPVPFSALHGVGTPGGPLDAATRNNVTTSARPQASSSRDVTVTIAQETWKSSSGLCTLNVHRALVSGLPADLAARINNTLAAQVAQEAKLSADTPASRNADCREQSKYFQATSPHRIPRSKTRIGPSACTAAGGSAFDSGPRHS